MAAPDQRPQLAQALQEVSQRTTAIVREEIELARTEVQTKLKTLGRGAGVAVAAGVFVALGGLLLLFFFAYLLGEYVFSDHVSWGFLVVAVVLFALAAVAGLLARKWLGTGAPKPELAIDEARRVRETLQSRGERP